MISRSATRPQQMPLLLLGEHSLVLCYWTRLSSCGNGDSGSESAGAMRARAMKLMMITILTNIVADAA